eukprot:CAMPEP_0173276408 /NCGR_PEP_ID=MMETSP1143-20121109/3506_1 /TAXON_ID=483371 /ORGANISM="non described non described, Strain CCMP2298" /LENGTH=246 /DNA_ID=CAMNT_0014213381 /DNA_START=31 /DNA_END=768 /DNA_ORIENTATION=+
MEALKRIRQLNAAAGVGRRPDESSQYPTQIYPTNRLFQIMHREALSASDVYTMKLHRGILREWLGEFVLDGRIMLPPAAVLSVASAAAWNSRHNYEHCKITDTENGALRLVDFEFLTDAVEVVDTRAAGSIQAAATCLHTVVEDSGAVAVYHKTGNSVASCLLKIAQGRVVFNEGDVHESTGTGTGTGRAVSTLDQSHAACLLDCYELPPSVLAATIDALTKGLRLDQLSRLCLPSLCLHRTALRR